MLAVVATVQALSSGTLAVVPHCLLALQTASSRVP